MPAPIINPCIDCLPDSRKIAIIAAAMSGLPTSDPCVDCLPDSTKLTLIAQAALRGGFAFSGSGSPNGVQSATGIAWYFDISTPSSPTLWFKATAGTSSTDWIILGTFSNS